MSDMLHAQELTVEGVSFSYGRGEVVSGVSFRAKAGELIAIVGPNGCGKSTLLRVIVGELKPAAGTVSIDGRSSGQIKRVEMAQRVAMVPQQMGGAAAAFGYTVREMVLMGRHAAHAETGWTGMGFETVGDLQLANEAMWAADVHHLAERTVETLSGGERQRVSIARAFTQQTPIVLLDEPTSALDLYHQLELVEQLRRVTEVEKRIVLLVTHDLNLAAAHATRALVMDRGRLVANGTVREVLVPSVLEPVYRVTVEIVTSGALCFSRKK